MAKYLRLLTAIIAASAFGANAETLANQTATVTVQNTFSLGVVNNGVKAGGGLSFGTIRATASTGEEAVYTIMSDGSAASQAQGAVNDALITVLIPGSPLQLEVTGAAPYTNLTITVPSSNINITAATAPPNSPRFIMQPNFGSTGWNATIDNGPNAGDAYTPSVPNLQTDSSGTATFSLGGTIKTETGGAIVGNFIDAIYTGTFSVGVDY